MLEKDIKNILSLNPNHISCYSLTVHEHTVFYINKIEEPDEEYAYNAYKVINELLENSGYSHYEVSNWAKPGFESKHNLTYWYNKRYYGIGLGASGYIDNVRYKNTTNLEKYISNKNELEEEIVGLEDEKQYEIMLQLRTKFGLNLKDFQEKFGEDLYKLHKQVIDDYVARGYLVYANDTISPTFEGMMILDKIYLDLA